MEGLLSPKLNPRRRTRDRFGTHPTQCATREHGDPRAGGGEPGRLAAFTISELQAFFDLADELVVNTRQRGREGWLSAFRDATVLKVTYAWGLRRREVRMLDLEDFGSNPQAPESGRLGVLYVRQWQGHEGFGPEAAQCAERVRLGDGVA